MNKQPIELRPEDAAFLGTATTVFPKTLVRAINRTHTVNMIARFAPTNLEERKERLTAIATEYGIEPMIISRPVHIYCGNNVLPAIASLGSTHYCLQRGHNAVNQANG